MNRTALASLFVSTAIFIAALAGYAVWYHAVLLKKDAAANLDQRIAAQTEEASRINFARTELSEIASDEQLVSGYFLPEDGVVSFIDMLEASARANGATLNVRSVSASVPGADQKLSFSLIVSGSFNAVARAIGAIEYLPYDLSISSLALTSEGKGTWRAQVGIAVGSLRSPGSSSGASVPPVTPAPLQPTDVRPI